MPTIRRRNGKWQVQVRRQNLPALSKTFFLKSDAESWGRQQEVNLDKNILPTAKTNLTFGDLLRRYADEITVKKRGARFEKARIQSVLRHPISQLGLEKLLPEIVASYRNQRLNQVQPASVRRELTILSHVLETAKSDWGVKSLENPFKAVKRPADSRPRDRRLLTDEYAQLLDGLASCRNPLIRAVFLFAIATGMRRGEILGLCWSHINWTARTARLDVTKNGEKRIVPLSPAALVVLQDLLRVGGEANKTTDERIFPISANGFRLAWERAKKRAGINGLRFHDMRHEAVSRFFEMGLTVPEVSLISGHKDVKMLLRYTHLKPENVADKLKNLLSI